MTSLDKILGFIKLTHKLQRVERAIYVNGTKRHENDLEHQYQLAMLAWYLVSSKDLGLNRNKVIQYSLIHDIVEVYAGDTFFFGPNNNKVAREKKAALRLKREFPEFYDLHRLIKDYEARKDKESKFVYGLDKLITTYNNYLDGGKIWRDEQVTLQMIIAAKKDKVAINDETKKQFRDIISLLKKHEGKLFGNKS